MLINPKIYFLAILTLLLASCSSNIRFSSNLKKSDGRGFVTAKNSTINQKSSTKQTKNALAKQGDDKPIFTDSEELYYITEMQMNLIEESERWIGVPYRFGGNDKSGIDCSAFVKNVFDKLGLEIPRTAHQQFLFADDIDENKRQIGDLVFFANGSKISHVGIYFGDNNIIHSSTSKGVVVQELNSKYWNDRYVGIKRINKSSHARK